MFRVNSISKQIVRLNVIESGRPQLVTLLPKNFVFTESVTDQMIRLEKDGVIRVRESKNIKPTQNTVKPVKSQPDMNGGLDFVDSKLAKVQKKKK